MWRRDVLFSFIQYRIQHGLAMMRYCQSWATRMGHNVTRGCGRVGSNVCSRVREQEQTDSGRMSLIVCEYQRRNNLCAISEGWQVSLR